MVFFCCRKQICSVNLWSSFLFIFYLYFNFFCHSLFHHPDLLLSPSKCKAEPDVTRRKSPCPLSEQLNSGRKSPYLQTNQSNTHKMSQYPLSDQSPGSSVDNSSAASSRRWVSYNYGYFLYWIYWILYVITWELFLQVCVSPWVWTISGSAETPGAECRPAGGQSQRSFLCSDTHDESSDRAGRDQSNREPGPL